MESSAAQVSFLFFTCASDTIEHNNCHVLSCKEQSDEDDLDLTENQVGLALKQCQDVQHMIDITRLVFSSSQAKIFITR